MGEWALQTFYFVAIPRLDGTAPTLEKAIEGRFFLDPSDAQAFRLHTLVEDGITASVFFATATIPRQKPLP